MRVTRQCQPTNTRLANSQETPRDELDGTPTGEPTVAPTTATCESFQCPADYKTLVPCPGPLCKNPEVVTTTCYVSDNNGK